MARPCYHCLEMMKAVNIRYCYYSTFDGVIIREKVIDMISIQISNNTTRNLQFITHYNFDKNICENNEHINELKMEYYEILMKKIFTKNINKLSLDYFIQYNFNILFPNNYYYIICKNKITFYNNLNNIINTCIII